MFKFNLTKIWFSKTQRKYFEPTQAQIYEMVKGINSNHGGILTAGKELVLSGDALAGGVVVASGYTMVVIQNKLYVLIRELGRGYFGCVFQGYDPVMNKLVAIKKQPIENSHIIVKQSVMTRGNGIGKSDPGVNAGPSFLADKHGYFVMPLADTSYDKWVKNMFSQGKTKLVIQSLVKICRDLIDFHSKGKVHMDLKLDNILVVNDVAFISDFGKTESRGSFIPSSNVPNHTQYPQCAPELFSSVTGRSIYTVSSKFDLWSFGFVLREVAKKAYGQIAIELRNISTYLYKMNPDERASLETVVGYLTSIEKCLT